MGNKRFLNLNNFDITTKEDATLTVMPFDVNNITQANLIKQCLALLVNKQPFYLKSKRAKKPLLTDTTDAVWTPVIKISDSGTPEEYCDRVKWWFDNISAEYKEQTVTTYKNLPDLITHIQAAKTWLLTTGAFTQSHNGKFIKRRIDINKFIKGWLTRTYNKIARS